jgi:hypothetical protein
MKPKYFSHNGTFAKNKNRAVRKPLDFFLSFLLKWLSTSVGLRISDEYRKLSFSSSAQGIRKNVVESSRNSIPTNDIKSEASPPHPLLNQFEEIADKSLHSVFISFPGLWAFLPRRYNSVRPQYARNMKCRRR